MVCLTWLSNHPDPLHTHLYYHPHRPRPQPTEYVTHHVTIVGHGDAPRLREGHGHGVVIVKVVGGAKRVPPRGG